MANRKGDKKRNKERRKERKSRHVMLNKMNDQAIVTTCANFISKITEQNPTYHQLSIIYQELKKFGPQTPHYILTTLSEDQDENSLTTSSLLLSLFTSQDVAKAFSIPEGEEIPAKYATVKALYHLITGDNSRDFASLNEFLEALPKLESLQALCSDLELYPQDFNTWKDTFQNLPLYAKIAATRLALRQQNVELLEDSLSFLPFYCRYEVATELYRNPHPKAGKLLTKLANDFDPETRKTALKAHARHERRLAGQHGSEDVLNSSFFINANWKEKGFANPLVIQTMSNQQVRVAMFLIETNTNGLQEVYGKEGIDVSLFRREYFPKMLALMENPEATDLKLAGTLVFGGEKIREDGEIPENFSKYAKLLADFDDSTMQEWDTLFKNENTLDETERNELIHKLDLEPVFADLVKNRYGIADLDQWEEYDYEEGEDSEEEVSQEEGWYTSFELSTIDETWSKTLFEGEELEAKLLGDIQGDSDDTADDNDAEVDQEWLDKIKTNNSSLIEQYEEHLHEVDHEQKIYFPDKMMLFSDDYLHPEGIAPLDELSPEDIGDDFLEKWFIPNHPNKDDLTLMLDALQHFYGYLEENTSDEGKKMKSQEILRYLQKRTPTLYTLIKEVAE